MNVVLMETQETGEGLLVTGHLHQPIPERTWETHPGAVYVLPLERGVTQGKFRWPTKCGKQGVIYVDCSVFSHVPRCPDCHPSRERT